MSVYKDEERGTWYYTFRATDWQGKSKQYKKRGFATKREAAAAERDAIAAVSRDAQDYTVKQLATIYLDDLKKRVKFGTYCDAEKNLRLHVLPYFESALLSELTPVALRKWQNEIISTLSPSYQRQIHSRFSAMLNYAVRFHGMPKNNLSVIGSIGSAKPNKKYEIWTLEQYLTFRTTLTKLSHRVYFDILFYCGLRIGELLALTWGDVNGNAIHVYKNKEHRTRFIDTPKTPSSHRTVTIPQFLVAELKEFKAGIYGVSDENIICPYSEGGIINFFRRNSKKVGLPLIRLHDLRHSHASLLIQKHVPITAISQRLGHANANITLAVYGHFYISNPAEIASLLDELPNKA